MREGNCARHNSWLWLGCLFLFSAFSFAMQIDAEPLATEPSPQARLIKGWDNYLEAKRQKDEFTRKNAFSEIQKQLQGSSGTLSEQASLLFLEEGYRELDLGDFEEARREFLNAAQLNPFLWPAYVGLAQVKLERDQDYRYYVSLCLKGFRAAFQLNNTYFILDAVIWLLERLSLVLRYSIILFLLLLSLKYLRPCHASTVNALEQRDIKTNIAQVFALLVMVLPLVLGFNLLLCAVGYLIILFPFFEPREKAVAMTCTATYLLAAFVLLVMNHIVTAKADLDFRVQLTQFYRGSPEAQLETLKRRLDSGDHDDKVLFAVGKLEKQAGRIGQALEYYEKLSERSPFWALAQVNIGNIYFSGHEYQKAISAYETAIRARPGLGVALYNLSVTQSQLGEHREAEQFLRQAKAMDPDLIDQLMIRPDIEQNSVVDADFDPKVTLKEAIFGLQAFRNESWYLFGFFLAPILLVIAALLLATFHAKIRHQRLLAKSCQKCGNLFFISESPNHEWCSQCVNLYLRKGDLPSEAKINKYEEVQRFNRRKRRLIMVIQFFFPGAKSIFKGAPWSGWITLTFWVFLLVFCFSSVKDISYPYMRFLRDDLIFDVFIWGTTFFYWLIFGLRAIWRED